MPDPLWDSPLADVLDLWALAVVLVTARARVRFANRTARAIISAGDGLHLGPDGLRAETPSQTAALRDAIAAASARKAMAHGGVLALHRRSARRSLLAVVLPARRDAGALLLLADPERAPSIPAAYLRRLYGLTPTEALVAQVALRGAGLPAIATALGVSVNTARSHLQRVFDKTGTRRQAELTALLLRSAPFDDTPAY